jgi:DNA-binding MarR family transcriptional regulator
MPKKSVQTSNKTTENGKNAVPEAQHLVTLKKLRIVIRAAQRHSAWIEKQCGVSGAQLWIMQELHETSGLRVGEIADRLAIHQTTTSNLLDVLEKRGLIVKARDTQDQRAVRLTLSETGAELLANAPKPARGLLPEALRHLDEEALKQLDQGLQGLLGSIDSMEEGFGLVPFPFNM